MRYASQEPVSAFVRGEIKTDYQPGGVYLQIRAFSRVIHMLVIGIELNVRS